ncbi:MFS general substrate transporter [Mycena amicta]|nr:MFS general substrate transporter [Mycena amicta]
MQLSAPNIVDPPVCRKPEHDPEVFELHDRTHTSDRDATPASGTPERALAERRLLRKLDFRLLPAVTCIFILNYIDRTAMTTARLKGFQQDLGLSDIQYSIILSILYVTYSPAQIPSNMILNKVTSPSIYIGCCVCIWGLASALTGITTDFRGALLCRLFVGLPEAAFYPGAVYLLSCWYTKKELALRSAILFSGLLISNAFGSLLAAGIFSAMEGVRGIPAWRWSVEWWFCKAHPHFLQGSVTICAGILMMWILPDFPRNTSWMTPAERRLAQTRMAEDAGEADKDTLQDSSLSALRDALREPIVWLFSLMGLTQLAGGGYGPFFPTLVKTLGFNTEDTLLLAAAPYVVAAIMCVVNAWHADADKTGERFFHVSIWLWGLIIGYIVSICSMSLPARYFSMFLLACSGASGGLMLAWVANAVPRPPAKRAAAIGIVNGITNLGSCISAYLWPTVWGPSYRESMGISLGLVAVSAVLALVIRQLLIRRNKELDASTLLPDMNSDRIKDAALLEGISLEEAVERRKVVRYMY